MAALTQVQIDALKTTLIARWNAGLKLSPDDWKKIAKLVKSNGKSNTYEWLSQFPAFREWVGSRLHKVFKETAYTVVNRKFESTVDVQRTDIEDDNIGQYGTLAESAGQSATDLKNDLVFQALSAGFASVCYDGQYFFDTDHKDEDGPVQSNKGTKVLSAASYSAARAQMMSLLDAKSTPLGIMPNLLVVPPQLEEAARKILYAEQIEGTTNTLKNTAELLVAPWLAANPTAWFLFDTSRAIKPLIFQQRKKPEFVSMDATNDQNVFMKKQYIYGVDCRDNAGFGLWQLAYGSTGAEA